MGLHLGRWDVHASAVGTSWLISKHKTLAWNLSIRAPGSVGRKVSQLPPYRQDSALLHKTELRTTAQATLLGPWQQRAELSQSPLISSPVAAALVGPDKCVQVL